MRVILFIERLRNEQQCRVIEQKATVGFLDERCGNGCIPPSVQHGSPEKVWAGLGLRSARAARRQWPVSFRLQASSNVLWVWRAVTRYLKDLSVSSSESLPQQSDSSPPVGRTRTWGRRFQSMDKDIGNCRSGHDGWKSE